MPLTCARCKTTISWPATFTEADQASLASTWRTETLGAVARFREDPGMTLTEAKGLAFHITCRPGECHRCHGPVEKREAPCPNCKCLNLDW
jgi:hypothetical protein